MARRQRSQFQSRRRSPNKNWAGLVATSEINVPAASKVLLSTLVLDNPGIDETILRTVGSVSIAPDQVAVTELQIGAIGLCIVSDTAAAAGIASLPDPVTDVADDVWLWYQAFAFELSFASAVGFDSNFAHMIQYDSRAKRIIQNGMSGVFVIANAHANHGFRVMHNSRVLTMIRGTG